MLPGHVGAVGGKLAVSLSMLEAADGFVVAAKVALDYGLGLRDVVIGARALRADGYALIHGYGPDTVVELTPAGRAYLTAPAGSAA